MDVEALSATTAMTPAATAELAHLRRAAGETVGAFFYGTLLRTMRESHLKGEYGHGGRGEEVFAGQLHNLMAERLGASSSCDLGEVVYRSLERQQRLVSETQASDPMGAKTANE